MILQSLGSKPTKFSLSKFFFVVRRIVPLICRYTCRGQCHTAQRAALQTGSLTATAIRPATTPCATGTEATATEPLATAGEEVLLIPHSIPPVSHTHFPFPDHMTSFLISSGDLPLGLPQQLAGRSLLRPGLAFPPSFILHSLSPSPPRHAGSQTVDMMLETVALKSGTHSTASSHAQTTPTPFQPESLPCSSTCPPTSETGASHLQSIHRLAWCGRQCWLRHSRQSVSLSQRTLLAASPTLPSMEPPPLGVWLL